MTSQVSHVESLELPLSSRDGFLRKLSANGSLISGTSILPTNSLEISDPMSLHFYISGKAISFTDLEFNDTGYTELLFEIPAELLDENMPEITVSGDHIAFGYWFYQ